MCNLKINITDYSKKKQTHKYRQLTCGFQGVKRREEGQIMGMGLTH